MYDFCPLGGDRRGFSVVLLAFPVCLLLFLFAPLSLITTRMFSNPVSRIGGLHDCKGGCNYSSGGWVLDTSRRSFYSADCPFHMNAWNCGKNKKLGVERISQWLWMPSNCSSWARMEPHSSLRATRGMRLGFIGDSLNENFMVSLLCILSAADGKARKWKRRGAWRGAYFPSYDVTSGIIGLCFFRNLQSRQRIELPGLGPGFRVDIDVPAGEFRADAHPSLWLGNKDVHLVWGQDCLHWCLPGLPDIWVDMLSAIVLGHIEAAQ